MSEEKRITIRTTEEFHGKLVRLSEQEKRSLNGQILTMLEDYFDPDALRARLAALEAQR